MSQINLRVWLTSNLVTIIQVEAATDDEAVSIFAERMHQGGVQILTHKEGHKVAVNMNHVTHSFPENA